VQTHKTNRQPTFNQQKTRNENRLTRLDNFESLSGHFHVVGSSIQHKESTDSTMNDAWELATDQGTHGAVVVADHQTQGRGRHAREWVSARADDILVSIVMKVRPAIAHELLMISSLAVLNVVDAHGIKGSIKWPNDVQVDGKKIAGVIAESRTVVDSDGADSRSPITSVLNVVVGIGLNVNSMHESTSDAKFEATSLRSELGRAVDRSEAFSQLLSSLDNFYRRIDSGESVVSEWASRITTIGRKVTVADVVNPDRDYISGTAVDIDPLGRLIVRDESGRDWPVSGGEVTVVDIE
jgi:BirA family biotin operon repressor/biotin-[acetyl-CoA-carboxylase] ligase